MCVVLLGAAAEAKVYKSYEDVLKSGDKADIEAMQASLAKAGYDSDRLQLESPPQAWVWLQVPPSISGAPPRFVVFGPGRNVVAGGYPTGGTFSWSRQKGTRDAQGNLQWADEAWPSDPGSGSEIVFPGDQIGEFKAKVTYTVGAAESDPVEGRVNVYAGDVDIEGLADGDPEDPDPNDAEATTGVLIGLNGTRKNITLAAWPAVAFPEAEPATHYSWQAEITGYVGHVQFWTDPSGGQQVSPNWYGHIQGGQWLCLPVPSELCVQGIGTGEGTITFHCSVDDTYGTPVPYTDSVKFTVMEAQLDADGLDNQHEEDPGAFLGVGATRKMYVRKPTPTGPLVPTDKVKLSWTNDDAVHVWDNVDKTGVIENGHEFAISDLTEGDDHSLREVYVEGVQPSDELKDVVFTLRYMREGAETEDVVKFTVVGADLDIDDLSEEQEDDPGGFVGRRRDGNDAPRKKIILQKVTPDTWTGVVHLTGSDDKLSVYTTETSTVDVLSGGGWNCATADLPKNLWVQGDSASAIMRDALMSLTPNGIAGDGDSVKFTVLDVDLEAAGVQESDEDDPGAFVGRGGEHVIHVHEPLPAGHLPPTTELEISWTEDAKMDLWKDAEKTQPVGNGERFTVAALRAEQSPWPDLHVEGIDASGVPADVSITLRYLHPDAQPEDVVNFTVLAADIDIIGLTDPEEENPGGFVVRRHDGNNAPRSEIVIGPVSPTKPEPDPWHWDGDVVLQRLNGNVTLFDDPIAGNEITFNGTDNRFASSDLVSEPKHFWVQGDVASVTMRDTGLTLDPDGVDGGMDIIRFTVLDVNLEAAGLQEDVEEDPGAFLEVNYDDDDEDDVVDSLDQAVAGEDDMVILKLHRPSPADLPDAHHVKLTWDSDAKVDVFEGQNKSTPIQSGRQYTLEQLASPKLLYVEGDLPSGSLRDVVFELQYVEGGENAKDTVMLTVWQISLKSVEFSGENNDEFQSVYVDTSGDAYDAPHWVDNSDPLDGDAEDWAAPTGDRQYPVCYVRATKPKVTVKVLIAPHDWFSQGARIKGDGPGDVDFQSVAASLAQENGKWYATAAITASHVLGNTVYHYDPKGDPGNPFAVAWSLSRDDGGSWHQMPPSENEMFVTLAALPDPLPPSYKLYRTVAYLATANSGATTASQALANTWGLFSPRNVCAWNEEHRLYDRALHYYLNYNENITVSSLLSTGDGQCGAWALLFRDSLAANGISATGLTEVDPPTGFWGFGVKEIHFNDTDPAYPGEQIWKYDALHDLDLSVTGIPGQNTPTPASKLFNLHYVYLVGQTGGPYYDPSYGVTYQDEADFTSAAVAAWAKVIDGQVHWCKAEDQPNAVVEFN